MSSPARLIPNSIAGVAQAAQLVEGDVAQVWNGQTQVLKPHI